jgi:hypothetical protein
MKNSEKVKELAQNWVDKYGPTSFVEDGVFESVLNELPFKTKVETTQTINVKIYVEEESTNENTAFTMNVIEFSITQNNLENPKDNRIFVKS